MARFFPSDIDVTDHRTIDDILFVIRQEWEEQSEGKLTVKYRHESEGSIQDGGREVFNVYCSILHSVENVKLFELSRRIGKHYPVHVKWNLLYEAGEETAHEPSALSAKMEKLFNSRSVKSVIANLLIARGECLNAPNPGWMDDQPGLMGGDVDWVKTDTSSYTYPSVFVKTSSNVNGCEA